MNKLLEGFKIIEKYDPDFLTAVGQDQVWAGSDSLSITDDDKAKLDILGWFIFEESWSCFT